ncbi:MAG: hypothetical protein AAFN11_21060 [Chloroflexota bacterium]
MDANIRSLLTSADPADRIRGMEMLVQSGDPDTLKILHRLYKSDADPNVKAQAAAFGKQLQNGGGSSSSEKPKKKAPRDPAGAQQALKAAENDLFNLDYESAKKNAQRAFMLDPSLQHDEYAVNLAADITGTMKAVAVDTLMQDAPRPTGSMAYAGTNMPGTAQEQVGCMKALFDVSIYAGLQAILFLIGALAVSAFTNAILDALDVPLNTIPFAIAGTVAVFIFQALALMIWMAIVHFCATTILSGKGFYTNLLHNVRNPMIAYFIVSTVISFITFFALIGFSFGAITDVANAFGEVDMDRLAVAIENGDDRAVERELLVMEEYLLENAGDLEDFEQRLEQGQANSPC